MAKTKISEFSANPANNTDIDSINIAEGCAPSGINDAIRELMAQLKDFQAGTAGDSFNGPIGTTTAAAGAFTTLTTSSTVTLNGGTANGVAYLNGSKVLTTGSALTFDGGNALSWSSSVPIYTQTATTGTNYSLSRWINTGGTFYTGIDNSTGANFGAAYAGVMWHSGNYPLLFGVNGSEQMRLTSTGLGIGTSSPAAKLHVSGDALANTFKLIANTTVSGSDATIFRPADNTMAFSTNGAERMRLDSSGNLGIGTSSIPTVGATTVLAVGNSSGGTLGIVQSGSISYRITAASGGVDCYNANATPITWYTNATSRMTLDSSGNLGLGVTPSAWNSNYKALQVKGASLFQGVATSEASLSANNYVDAVGDKYIASNYATCYTQYNGQHIWKTAPSGTAGNAISFTQAMTLDASGRLLVGVTSTLGYSEKLGIVGTIAQQGAQFNIVSGTSAQYEFVNRSSSAGFDFYVNAGSNLAARIDSSGNLLVGTTSPVQSGRFSVANTADTVCIGMSASGTGNTTGTFLNCVDSSDIRFRVFTNGNVQNTNNSYGAISDAKLKENVTDATPKLEKLNQVRVVNFNMIGDEQKQIGVVAQELEQIFPGMVEEAPDRDADGNDLGTTTKSVKYSVFVPMLIKAIQEQQTIIESLKARLDAANL